MILGAICKIQDPDRETEQISVYKRPKSSLSFKTVLTHTTFYAELPAVVWEGSEVRYAERSGGQAR